MCYKKKRIKLIKLKSSHQIVCNAFVFKYCFLSAGYFYDTGLVFNKMKWTSLDKHNYSGNFKKKTKTKSCKIFSIFFL